MKSIIIDALGADLGQSELASGVALGADNKHHFVFFGESAVIDPIMKDSGVSYEVRESSDCFSNCENPMTIVRGRETSSLSMALDALKGEDDCSGLISAGSTGALLIGSVFRAGLIGNMKFPSLCSLLPRSDKKMICLLDCGANVNPTADDLLLFARLGSAFMAGYYGIASPKVALLCVGSEKGKGNELARAAYPLIEDSSLNFAGNIEADAVFTSDVDVLVADGFTGNIFLKNTESVAQYISGALMGIGEDDPATVKAIRERIFSMFYYNDQAGAILLGCKKPIIKVHGKANRNTIASAIAQLCDIDDSGVFEKIPEIIDK